jgi:hypothetical protein
MSLQIIILNTNSQSDGSFSVSGVFWLTAPVTNIVPMPNFKSQVPFIDPKNLLALQYGSIVEQTFNSGLFASGTVSGDVQTALQSQFSDAQTALNNIASPLSGLIGQVYDGYSWTTSNPFVSNTTSINIAPQYTQRTYTWVTWKSLNALKGGQHQYDDNGALYKIWFYDGPEVNICTIWKGSVPPAQIQGGYSQAQNDSDKADFEANFKPTGNMQLVPRTPDGRSRQAVEKSLNTRTNFYSHNWCDSTTWYQQSVYVSGETATTDGYYTNYTLANHPVIDTYHGKLTLEDALKDSSNRSYRVSVKVDGYSKVEQDPHFGSGGDYTINYNTGVISFLTPLNAGNVVTVNYHYANITGNGTASRFTMAPLAGKKISIQMAEAQFSTDVVLNDTTQFEVWGIADYFLTPAQMAGLGIPANIGYKIMLQRFTYKTFNDFQNDAFRTYPTVAAIGGGGWRSQPVGMTVMDWDYVAATALHSISGMEIRAYLQHDAVMGGNMCTVTFYAFSESEP